MKGKRSSDGLWTYSMEEIEAWTDIQHVISFDRPAHPFTFWLGDLRGWGYHEISTHSPQLPLSLSVLLLSILPFLFLSLPLLPTHLSGSLSSAWPGLHCLPPSCIPPALRWAWACLEHRERQYYTAAHTHKITADVSKTYRCHLCRALSSWLSRFTTARLMLWGFKVLP